MRFVGIDISKRTFHAALLKGEKFEKKSATNKEAGIKDFLTWLERHAEGPVHACMEATNTYWEELALALVQAGHTVSVENPKFIHHFAKTLNVRTKSDAADATLIARYCQALLPAPWQPPAPEVAELRQLLRRYEELVRMRTQERNRLGDSSLHPEERSSLETHLAYLENEVKRLEQLIRSHSDHHGGLHEKEELLKTIPGIGEKTAWTLLAKLRPIEAYGNGKQMAAFVGVTPREFSSGTSVKGQSRMCKVGDRRIRALLYMAALSALRTSQEIQAFAERLALKGKARKSVIGAVMRKLMHLTYGVLKHGRPYDPALVQGPILAPATI